MGSVCSIDIPRFKSLTVGNTYSLKGNCNAKTSRFHLKGRSISCKMRPKSLKSAKPFSRYSTVKMEIWTVLRGKKDRKTENVVFFRGFAQTEEQQIV